MKWERERGAGLGKVHKQGLDLIGTDYYDYFLGNVFFLRNLFFAH